jgi:hypothetical protein
VGVKLSATVGVPGVASGSTEVTATLGFEATQQNMKTKENTYNVEDSVELTGPGDFRIQGYVDFVDDLVVPFKARCHISAKQGEFPLTAHMISILLNTMKYGNGFTGKIDRNVDQNTSEAVLNGSFTGSYGVNRRIVVTKKNPEALTDGVVKERALENPTTQAPETTTAQQTPAAAPQPSSKAEGMETTGSSSSSTKKAMAGR